MTRRVEKGDEALVPTGIGGLNDILAGGLTAHRVYLVQGDPGSGKTTLALQYLLEGARRGEKGVYVTLSETKAELVASARSHGWDLDPIEIVELMASEDELDAERQHTMFEPAEVELSATTNAILSTVDRVKPVLLVIDSLSEMRLLAQSALRYRRQILALKQFFIGRECTVLLLDDKTSYDEDCQLQSIAHGVISLEQSSPEYGGNRRRLCIPKLRGQKYRGGNHDYKIETGGLVVFPRLVAAEHVRKNPRGLLHGGSKELDTLLGGGVDFGTSVLLVGPAGSGKSVIATTYVHAGALSGVRAAMFIFDERVEVLIHRAKGLNIDLEPHLKSGLVTIQQIDPAELSPGEFVHRVRQAVSGGDGHPPAQVIVIDSLNGYIHAMPEESSLTAQLHELLTYLGHSGVATFLVLTQQGIIGQMTVPVDTTYLADTVIMLRYFEARGEVRQALSVVKKRSGKHERTIRELSFDGGVRVGEVLDHFQGVLSGVPVFKGEPDKLMNPKRT